MHRYENRSAQISLELSKQLPQRRQSASGSTDYDDLVNKAFLVHGYFLAGYLVACGLRKRGPTLKPLRSVTYST